MTDKDESGLGDEELKKNLQAEAESQQETEKPDAEEAKAEPEEEEQESESFEDTDEPEIPTRAASHIIQRQRETIEKLRSQKEEEVEEPVIIEDDESEVDRSVKKHLTPVLEALKAQEDDKELNSLVAEEPEAKGYERAIKAFMKHPAWAQVPASAIFHHLHYQQAKSSTQKAKELADKEAAQMSTVGSTHRSTKTKKGNFPSADEIDEMTDAELDELAHKARTGAFSPK